MTKNRLAPAGAAPGAPGAHGAMTAVEWAMLAGLSVVWGASFFFNKILLGVFEPLTVLLGRVGLAALALTAAIYLMGGRLPATRATWLAFAGMSLVNNVVPFALILWGQKHIASGLAAILNATTPLFAAMFAHLLAGERLTAHRLAGVVIGMAGVVVMVGPDVLATGLGGDVLAQLACLGGAISYGFAVLYGRRFTRMGIRPHIAAAGQLTVSTVIVLPLALLVDRPWTLAMPGIEIWAALCALALVSTSLAYVIYFRLISGAGAVNASLVTLLVPVSALMLGTLALGEVFTLRQAAGMAVILLGLVVTDGRFVRYLFKGKGV